MFYGVYCYEMQGFNNLGTYLLGYYETLDEAKRRLAEILPNYVKYHKNTVQSGNKVGWINEYEFGNFYFDVMKSLNVSQPIASVNLFT